MHIETGSKVYHSEFGRGKVLSMLGDDVFVGFVGAVRLVPFDSLLPAAKLRLHLPMRINLIRKPKRKLRTKTLICKTCGKEFTGVRAKTCSELCRVLLWRKSPRYKQSKAELALKRFKRRRQNQLEKNRDKALTFDPRYSGPARDGVGGKGVDSIPLKSVKLSAEEKSSAVQWLQQKKKSAKGEN